MTELIKIFAKKGAIYIYLYLYLSLSLSLSIYLS